MIREGQRIRPTFQISGRLSRRAQGRQRAVARRRPWRYTYDFGDDWEHDLAVDAVAAAEPGVAYPRCLSGRRACPPEDYGGGQPLAFPGPLSIGISVNSSAWGLCGVI